MPDSAAVDGRHEDVIVKQRDRVLIVTINRPHAKNAVNSAVSHGLADAMDWLDADPALSVAVLTGAGGIFSAGMDLKAFARGEEIAIPGRGMGFTQKPPTKPVIAAVEGPALAGGTEIILATDLVAASNDASFGLPEVKRGLVAGGGALLRLPHRIPYQVAVELALTGRSISAQEALQYGLVNRLTEPGGALAAALELAEEITANGPLAIAATKKILADAGTWSREEAWVRQEEICIPVFASNDAGEGARAFAEKRPPAWTGT